MLLVQNGVMRDLGYHINFTGVFLKVFNSLKHAKGINVQGSSKTYYSYQLLLVNATVFLIHVNWETGWHEKKQVAWK